MKKFIITIAVLFPVLSFACTITPPVDPITPPDVIITPVDVDATSTPIEATTTISDGTHEGFSGTSGSSCLHFWENGAITGCWADAQALMALLNS